MNLYKDEAIIRGVTYSASGGHKVTLEVTPEGWEELKARGVGTRCAMVLVEIDNDDRPVEQPKRKPKSRAEMAGILCNDKKFREYLWGQLPMLSGPETVNGMSRHLEAEEASEVVRRYCGVESRAELNTNAQAAAKWEELHNGFNASIGRSGEP